MKILAILCILVVAVVASRHDEDEYYITAKTKVESGGITRPYYLNNDAMVRGSGPREDNIKITFKKSFTKAPQIQYGIVGLDAGKDDNLRYGLKVVEVTPKYVVFRFNTWGDTKIHLLEFSWMAIQP